MVILLLVIGGLINTYRIHGYLAQESAEEAPYKAQGYFMAFIMGCIFMGLPAAVLYWIVF